MQAIMTSGSSPLRDAAGHPAEADSLLARPAAAGSVVILRTGGITEAVVALPCFHGIARAFPGTRKILLSSPSSGPRDASVQNVIEGTGLIDSTLHFSAGSTQLWHPLALVQELRQLAPRALVYLGGQPAALSVYRDLVLFKAAGIPRVIGAPWHIADSQCRTLPKTGELEYEAERLVRVLGSDIPADLSPPSWDLRLSATERACAEQQLARLPPGALPLALAAGASRGAEDWGEARWATLIGLLHLRLAGVALVLVGASADRARAKALGALWRGPWIDLCGELTPRQSAAVLERCRLLVCHEGGAMHLAASRGTPCIALSGTDRPHQWYPFGEQHVVLHEPRGIREIGVENVADAVVAAVDRLRAGRRLTEPGKVLSG
jgi:ADP-heptose:LPS heptosyltransferase